MRFLSAHSVQVPMEGSWPSDISTTSLSFVNQLTVSRSEGLQQSSHNVMWYKFICTHTQAYRRQQEGKPQYFPARLLTVSSEEHQEHSGRQELKLTTHNEQRPFQICPCKDQPPLPRLEAHQDEGVALRITFHTKEGFCLWWNTIWAGWEELLQDESKAENLGGTRVRKEW